MEFNKCYACMRELDASVGKCRHCGYNNRTSPTLQPDYALPCGAVLAGRYVVGRILGESSFAITYIAYDLKLNLRVCIREFFSHGDTNRNSKQSSMIYWNSQNADDLKNAQAYFVKQAQKKAKLHDLNNIASVWDVFYENNTAYAVMEYIEGETLKNLIVKQGKPLDGNRCLNLFEPIIKELQVAHSRGIVHCDIMPDNFILTPEGKLVLLSLSSAKEQLLEQEMNPSALLVENAYTPFDQHVQNEITGPWTDVYSMCATIYYCVKGTNPPSPSDQICGTAIDYSGISLELKNVLQKGLALKPENRIQSMDDLLSQLRAAIKSSDQSGRESLETHYQKAKALMNRGSIAELKNAESILVSLGQYRDAAQLAETCRSMIKEHEKAPAPKKPRPQIIGAITAIVITALLLFGFNGSIQTKVKQLITVVNTENASESTAKQTQPTSVPKSTATAKPASTSKPTATAKPTSAPKATATAKPTSTPKPSATVKPTSTPKPSATPNAGKMSAQNAASKVEKQISDLGEITIDSEERVRAARTEYDALSNEAKKYVSNLDILINAEQSLQTLLDNQAMAEIKRLYSNTDYEGTIALAEEYYSGRDLKTVPDEFFDYVVWAYAQRSQQYEYDNQYEKALKLMEKCVSLYSQTAFGNKAQEALDRLNAKIDAREPSNGQIIQATVNSGYCKLTIKNGADSALVKLVSIDEPERYYLEIYVRENETASVNVRDGNYYLKYATGERWYGNNELFGSKTSYTKADTIVSFTTSYSGSYVNYNEQEITLYKVANGNLTTTPISEDDF
jgi:serine/threonine protein kinase